jgi:hypothetical protein
VIAGGIDALEEAQARGSVVRHGAVISRYKWVGMRCAVCSQRPATADALCEVCVEELDRPYRFTRDRVRTVGVPPSTTVLIDPWGRPHPFHALTLIGRQVDGAGIEVVETTVSRHHAQLARSSDGGWIVRDLGSTNGTFVNGARVTETAPIRARDRLRVGHVGFFFAELPVLWPGPTRGGGRTRIAPDTAPEEPIPLPPSLLGDDDDDEDDAAFEEGVASTRIGLPTVPIALHPLPGRGGVIEIEGASAQLTLQQFELIALLHQRAVAEAGGPEATRGFVSSLELIDRISWETPQRIEGHLKQLVRRLRRVLERAGLGDLIESRAGSGYRLRATPRPVTP